MGQRPSIRQASIWRAALLAVAAGCDAGNACAGCVIPEFTVSDGDAGLQAAPVQVAVQPQQAQAEIDFSEEAGSYDASYSANAPSWLASGSIPSGSASEEAGYTVVRRYYAPSNPAPAASQSAGIGDGATPASAASSVDAAEPQDTGTPPVPSPQPELNVVLVPLDEPPGAPPRVNIAPVAPRSIVYPMPPVPGR
jgi:hypothetical protein